MKYFIFLAFILINYSCFKKKAIKVDHNLVGTWVSNTTHSRWLVIKPNGDAYYRVYENRPNGKDFTYEGPAKYSLFERKFYVGSNKFYIIKENTGYTDGVTEVSMKIFPYLDDTLYQIDRKMILKTSLLYGRIEATFYRVKNS